jgi:hypothetical protein
VSLLNDRSADRALQEIRPRARQVAEQAQHVGVVRDRVRVLAR